MESTRCENSAIEQSKYVLDSVTKELRELIGLYRFKTDKRTLKILRKALKNCDKLVYDEKEDDFEYLKDDIDELKSLKNTYLDTNKYHDYRAKYLGTDETFKYLFENRNEDYSIYKTGQYGQ